MSRQNIIQKIDKIMQSGNPIYFYEVIFKYWAEARHIRGFRAELYTMLAKLGPRLRASVGEDWQVWRSRLMPYTNYVLKGRE